MASGSWEEWKAKGFDKPQPPVCYPSSQLRVGELPYCSICLEVCDAYVEIHRAVGSDFACLSCLTKKQRAANPNLFRAAVDDVRVASREKSPHDWHIMTIETLPLSYAARCQRCKHSVETHTRERLDEVLAALDRDGC